MNITKEWLIEKKACIEGLEWFKNQTETDGKKVVEKLIAEDKLEWANWLLPQMMEYKQCVSYAVFAAEQAIDLFEKRYPTADKRPRQAIEAAKRCIEDSSEENKKAAVWAAAAAADAAWAEADWAAAAWAAKKEMMKKILNYGLEILN